MIFRVRLRSSAAKGGLKLGGRHGEYSLKEAEVLRGRNWAPCPGSACPCTPRALPHTPFVPEQLLIESFFHSQKCPISYCKL